MDKVVDRIVAPNSRVAVFMADFLQSIVMAQLFGTTFCESYCAVSVIVEPIQSERSYMATIWRVYGCIYSWFGLRMLLAPVDSGSVIPALAARARRR
jgi:hypothetical protein